MAFREDLVARCFHLHALFHHNPSTALRKNCYLCILVAETDSERLCNLGKTTEQGGQLGCSFDSAWLQTTGRGGHACQTMSVIYNALEVSEDRRLFEHIFLYPHPSEDLSRTSCGENIWVNGFVRWYFHLCPRLTTTALACALPWGYRTSVTWSLLSQSFQSSRRGHLGSRERDVLRRGGQRTGFGGSPVH